MFSLAALKLLVAIVLLAQNQVLASNSLFSAEDSAQVLETNNREIQPQLQSSIDDPRTFQEDRESQRRINKGWDYDTDLDGIGGRIRSKQALASRARLIRINQLLSSLGSSLSPDPEAPTPVNNPPATPTGAPSLSGPAPIFRSGRTYPTSSTGLNFDTAYKQQQTDQQNQLADKGSKGGPKKVQMPMMGLIWPASSGRPTSYVSVRRSQPSPSTKVQSSHHDVNSEEVAAHLPMHVRSSDYEWKRLESSHPFNARWNNLRGMWGKRSGQALTMRRDEEPANELTFGGEQQIQLEDIRPM